MVKPIMKKIISGIITVAIIFTCVSSPSYASAAINTPKLNWDNPNKSGTNPFKFKLQDSLNSNMVMSVMKTIYNSPFPDMQTLSRSENGCFWSLLQN